MIDLRHPLAVLSSRMPWQELEASVLHHFAKKVRAGKVIDEADLFGGISKLVGASVSPAGRPRLPLGLVEVGLENALFEIIENDVVAP